MSDSPTSSKTAQVVEGEASESESDVEEGRPAENISSNIDEFVVSGEASESEDEVEPATKPAPAISGIPTATSQEQLFKNNMKSLLHQKLWECNVRVKATLEGLLRHTVDISVEKLSSADKTLLLVQESMRAANANLTLAKARLKQIEQGLDKANCVAALPTVKIRS